MQDRVCLTVSGRIFYPSLGFRALRGSCLAEDVHLCTFVDVFSRHSSVNETFSSSSPPFFPQLGATSVCLAGWVDVWLCWLRGPTTCARREAAFKRDQNGVREEDQSERCLQLRQEIIF